MAVILGAWKHANIADPVRFRAGDDGDEKRDVRCV